MINDYLWNLSCSEIYNSGYFGEKEGKTYKYYIEKNIAFQEKNIVLVKRNRAYWWTRTVGSMYSNGTTAILGYVEGEYERASVNRNYSGAPIDCCPGFAI